MGTTPPATADHLRFDGEDFAERYLAGRLAPEEAAAFEVHYLDCEACLDRLDVARRLRDGLAQVTGSSPGPLTGEKSRPATGPGLLTRLVSSRHLGLALAAVLVVALLPAGLLWREVGQLRSDLAEAERQAVPPPARLQRYVRVAEANALIAELADARRELAEQRGQLDGLRVGLRRAEAAAAERARLAAEIAAARRPQVDPPLLTLSAERGGPDAADEPASRVTLTAAPEWVVLSLELGEVEAATYSASLRKDGASRWQGNLTPSSGALVLALPSVILEAGIYEVEVRAAAHAAPAKFRFQVRRR